MSLAIGVAVREGIVLAADSRATYPNPKDWPRIGSDHMQKVCRINDRIAVATCGWAVVNYKNIHTHVADFARSITADQTVEDVLPAFLDYFQQQYEIHINAGIERPVPDGHMAIGFIVAGYDASGVGRLYYCAIPGKRCAESASTANPGAVWQGQIEIVARLIKGVDHRLDRSGLDAETRKKLEGLELLISFIRMTPQDAIDFAIFLIRTTIDAQRFSDGIFMAPGAFPGVGGAIDVALVTPGSFQWIQQKAIRGQRE